MQRYLSVLETIRQRYSKDQSILDDMKLVASVSETSSWPIYISMLKKRIPQELVFSKVISCWLFVLIDSRLEADEISKLVRDWIDIQESRFEVEWITAKKSDQDKCIEDGIKKKHKNATIQHKIDKSIIGGIKIIVKSNNGYIVDNSVSTKLRLLKQAICKD